MAQPWRPDQNQGVFETLLVVDGRPVELNAHLGRLETSLTELFPDHDPPPLDVPVEGGPYGHLRTGTSASPSDAGTPSSMRIVVAPAGEAQLEARTYTREIDRDLAFDPEPVGLHSLPLAGGLGGHKWTDRSLLDGVQAGLPPGDLPLIVDHDCAVLEASRANVFALADGCLSTPPTDGRILPGVTRGRVLEIAAATGIEVREAQLHREDLLDAEEVFLTGSIRGIERVRSLDGIALGAVGEVSAELGAELRRTWVGAKVG